MYLLASNYVPYYCAFCGHKLEDAKVSLEQWCECGNCRASYATTMGQEKTLFACAISATSAEMTSTMSMLTWAVDEEQAEGQVLVEARQRWGEGWGSHAASVMEISRDYLLYAKVPSPE